MIHILDCTISIKNLNKRGSKDYKSKNIKIKKCVHLILRELLRKKMLSSREKRVKTFKKKLKDNNWSSMLRINCFRTTIDKRLLDMISKREVIMYQMIVIALSQRNSDYFRHRSNLILISKTWKTLKECTRLEISMKTKRKKEWKKYYKNIHFSLKLTKIISIM